MRRYDVAAAICGLLIVLVFAVRPVVDSMFLFAATGFPHIFLGFYRQTVRGKGQLIRILAVFILVWTAVLTLSAQLTLVLTITLIFVHYTLDNFFLFNEKASLPTVLAMGVLFLLSLFGSDIDSTIERPVAIGIYFVVFLAIGIWNWWLYDGFHSRVFAEVILIAVFAMFLIVYLGFGSLFYLYLPIDSLHYLNWYVSLENHLRENRGELGKYRLELVFFAFICVGGSWLYFYSEEMFSLSEYIFGAPYFCAWVCTHILANFRLSQVARILPSRAIEP